MQIRFAMLEGNGVGDAKGSWFRALRAEGTSPNTTEINASGVERFTEWLQRHHRPTDASKITREDVQGFLTHLHVCSRLSARVLVPCELEHDDPKGIGQ